MESDDLLPDGTPFGLRGYGYERDTHPRIGLAPPAAAIDRNPPYRRIATEEAWTIPELTEAHVRLIASGKYPDDPGLRMGGMFANMPQIQHLLQDIGEQRTAHMDAFGIARQLLLLTAPGVQCL